MTTDDSAWGDPDRAVQIEDNDPEALAGEEIEFDETVDDETTDGPDPEVIELHDRIAVAQEDLPSDPLELDAGTAKLPEPGGA